MKQKHTLKNAEKQTAKALQLSASEIFNFYASGAEMDDVETTSNILRKLADGIVIPETLKSIADLLNEIASEAERLAELAVDHRADQRMLLQHEAETTKLLCELISTNLMAKYSRHIGRV